MKFSRILRYKKNREILKSDANIKCRKNNMTRKLSDSHVFSGRSTQEQ